MHIKTYKKLKNKKIAAKASSVLTLISALGMH